MVTVNQVLNQARGYIGVTQNSDAHKKIIDKYNSVKPLPVGYAVKYSDDWCDAFVSVLFINLGASALIGRECGVERHVQIFKQLGIWNEDGTVTPKPGDIITFNWDYSGANNDGFADHIGIVESVSNGQITTIEGNTDRAVRRRTYQVGNGYIRGYARPKYSENSDDKVTSGIPKPVILDISEWQVPASINYDTVAKNIDGVIVRVQYGSLHEDVHYRTHIREFQKRNIPVAVYAWFRGNQDIKKQASDFYNRAKSFKPAFWWIDVEEKDITRAMTESYRAELKKLTNGKVGLYIANHLYTKINPDVAKFDGVWIPTYGKNTGKYEGWNPTSTSNYDIHQYTDKGKLAGIAGVVDLNRLVDPKKFDYLFGKSVSVSPKPAQKSIDTLAREVIDGRHGSGDARKKALGSKYDAVQKRVNELLKPKKSVSQIATEVINGKWGNGADREKRLRNAGYDPSTVQKEVNKKMTPKKSNAAIAREIYLGQGGWGTGQTRTNRLRNAGYDPAAVQREVNKLF